MKDFTRIPNKAFLLRKTISATAWDLFLIVCYRRNLETGGFSQRPEGWISDMGVTRAHFYRAKSELLGERWIEAHGDFIRPILGDFDSLKKETKSQKRDSRPVEKSQKEDCVPCGKVSKRRLSLKNETALRIQDELQDYTSSLRSDAPVADAPDAAPVEVVPDGMLFDVKPEAKPEPVEVAPTSQEPEPNTSGPTAKTKAKRASAPKQPSDPEFNAFKSQLFGHHKNRVGKILDNEKQAGAIKRLFKNEVTAEEAIACYDHFVRLESKTEERFRTKRGVSWLYVQSVISEFLANRRKTTVVPIPPNDNPSPSSPDQTAQILSMFERQRSMSAEEYNARLYGKAVNS